MKPTNSLLSLARDRAAKGEALRLKWTQPDKYFSTECIEHRLQVIMRRDGRRFYNVRIGSKWHDNVSTSALECQHYAELLLLQSLHQLVAVLDPAAAERERRVQRLCELVNDGNVNVVPGTLVEGQYGAQDWADTNEAHDLIEQLCKETGA